MIIFPEIDTNFYLRKRKSKKFSFLKRENIILEKRKFKKDIKKEKKSADQLFG